MPPIKARNMTPVSKQAKKHAVRRLIKYVFKYYPVLFIVVIFCIIGVSISSVAGSRFLGLIINNYIQPTLDAAANAETGIVDPSLARDIFISQYQSGFTTMMIVMGLMYLTGIICTYFYNYLMSYIGQGIQKRIRDELFTHMQELPISYFDTRTHGDIMSIYTNDVDALREMLARSLPMCVSSIMTMLVCFGFMLSTDLILTAIVISFAIMIFFITKYFAKMSAKNFINQQRELGATNGYIEEFISGQKVVKIFNYENRNIEGFDAHNESFCKYSIKANRFSNILMPTVNQLGNLQYVLIALVGGLFVANGITSYRLNVPIAYAVGIGEIVSFLLYSKSFVQPIGQVSMNFNTIALALAGASRIFDMMDHPTESDDGVIELVFATEDENSNPVESKERTDKWAWKHIHSNGEITYTWLKGDIVFEDVDFAYVKGKTILHDINLYARPGQKVAFVGPTGAGKTTITNLINRFYDIEKGKIRYDGINISKIKKSDLRKSLGMVLQDTKLFTGTIKENIRFGKLDATDEEIINAAKLANADYFIQHLENGYDTVLTNGGASLSQGQRQLIAIARAAVANPPVMILDEATSSIDSRTEAMVQQGMDQIMKGRTVFVIAHRLSTIKNSDVIMVLEDGRIIERGNHEQLLLQKGKYYQLYTGNAITQQE